MVLVQGTRPAHESGTYAIYIHRSMSGSISFQASLLLEFHEWTSLRQSMDVERGEEVRSGVGFRKRLGTDLGIFLIRQDVISNFAHAPTRIP